MENITWEVTEIRYCSGHDGDNWIKEPTIGQSGTDETSLVISIEPSFKGSEDCSAATIVISASTGDKQEIPVTRCLRECGCKSMKIIGTANQIAECGESNVLFGTYDKDCVCAKDLSVIGADASVVTSAWAEDGKIYGNVSKNPNKSQRTVVCNVFINGEQCDSLSLTQHELTGEYSKYVSGKTVTTGVTAYAISSTTFGCEGGVYKAGATKYFESDAVYAWVDSCGETHYDDTTTIETTGSTDLDPQEGKFSQCDSETSRSATLYFSDGGYSDSVTFYQDCTGCGPEPGECAIVGDTEIDSCGGGTKQYNIIKG